MSNLNYSQFSKDRRSAFKTGIMSNFVDTGVIRVRGELGTLFVCISTPAPYHQLNLINIIINTLSIGLQPKVVFL